MNVSYYYYSCSEAAIPLLGINPTELLEWAQKIMCKYIHSSINHPLPSTSVTTWLSHHVSPTELRQPYAPGTPALPASFLAPAIYYSHLRHRAVNRSCHSSAQIFWYFPMQIPYQKPAYHSHCKSHPILSLGDAPTAGPTFPDRRKYVCSCIRTLALVVFCFLPQLFTRTIL